jgi:hypothetical protein
VSNLALSGALVPARDLATMGRARKGGIVSHEKRQARRVLLNVPTLIKPLPPTEGPPAGVGEVYERVMPNAQLVGRSFPAVVRDISVNGAFIAGEPLPLLTRVSFSFPLEGYGEIEALGWSLWRREQDYEVPDPMGITLVLPKGFGVLFEAIPLDARIAIHKFVNGTK